MSPAVPVPLVIRWARFLSPGPKLELYLSVCLILNLFHDLVGFCNVVLEISALPCFLRAATVHSLSPTILMCCRDGWLVLITSLIIQTHWRKDWSSFLGMVVSFFSATLVLARTKLETPPEFVCHWREITDQNAMEEPSQNSINVRECQISTQVDLVNYMFCMFRAFSMKLAHSSSMSWGRVLSQSTS